MKATAPVYALALALAACAAPHFVASTAERAKLACPAGEEWNACTKRLKRLDPDDSGFEKTRRVSAAVCDELEAWETCFNKAQLAAGQVLTQPSATTSATFSKPYGGE